MRHLLPAHGVLLLLGLVLPACANHGPAAETSDLVMVQEYFETNQMLESGMRAGCVLYTPEGLEEIGKRAAWLEAHPEARVKSFGTVDRQGRKQGPWSEWESPRYFLLEKGEYRDDQRIGEWMIYVAHGPQGEPTPWWRTHYFPDGTATSQPVHVEESDASGDVRDIDSP